MRMVATPDFSRRRFLFGSAAAAALLAAPGCAYMTPKPNPVATKPVEPKIDGDLVYFNWADYLDPSVLKGFQKEYGVKIIQSNFDSMEGMYAKIAAGNRTTSSSRSPSGCQKLVAARASSAPSTPSTLTNADRSFYTGYLLHRPLVRPSVPRTRCRSPMYKTGIALAQRQDRRD